MNKAVNIFSAISEEGEIRSSNAFAIAFKNQGEAVAIINNALELLPGETISLNQDNQTIDDTTYNVMFSSSHPQATGSRKNLCIIRIGKK
jgi:hypothetical protein